MDNLNKYITLKKNTKNPLKSFFKKPIYYENNNFTLKKKNNSYFFLECNSKIDMNWRYAAYDVYPPLPPKVIILKQKKDVFTLGKISINNKNIGEMSYFDEKGKLSKLMGNYYILTDKNIDLETDHKIQKKNFISKIKKFFDLKEIKLFEAVTKQKFNKLIKKINSLSQMQVYKIASNLRWIDTSLNKNGLHVLRAILADKIYEEKIKNRTDIPYNFLKYGFIRIAFNKKKDFIKILKQISPNRKIQKNIQWRKSEVKYLRKDEQRNLHYDSFHNTFKVWVYPKNLTLNHGPLEIIPGSHINSKLKLRWLYYISNTKLGIKEPSFRLSKRWQSKFGKVKPIFPLKNKKTIIIVNTYVFHRRGLVKKNLTRLTYRLAGNNDGGIKRINPFI
jgi:hypothetical protein